VGDQGFDFGPPDTRDARQFEPPPWEREQFEQLARQRAEQLEAEETARAVVEQPSVFPPVAEGESGVDDQQIEAMMIGLRAEEPPLFGGTWIVTTMAAIVLGAVGLMLLVWGFTEAAKRGAGLTGAMGAGILVVFGLGFCGTGAWVAFRTLRQQGVL